MMWTFLERCRLYHTTLWLMTKGYKSFRICWRKFMSGFRRRKEKLPRFGFEKERTLLGAPP